MTMEFTGGSKSEIFERCDSGASNENEWQIVNHITDANSNWIEEEDKLLTWAETPDFEKRPLSQIAATFIYVNNNNEEVGIIKTSIQLDHLSTLHKTALFDKVKKAAKPNENISGLGPTDWSEKTYFFDDAAIYSIPINHEQIDKFEPKTTCKPLHFSKDPDVVKIECSLEVFHDLYEIFVIMREVKKSILKTDSKSGKTKKVRISDDSPNKYVFSKLAPIAGKRRTKRNR